MKKFRVCIEETVSDEFEVEATTEKEALEIARNKYRNGDFVLEPGWVEDVQMVICGENEKGFNELWRGRI